MPHLLKQNGTNEPLLFLLVLASDHLTPATGLSPTVTISKNGGGFNSPAGAVSELANGWYSVAASAGDRDTLGPLLLHATAATADPVDDRYHVVAFDPRAATNLGLSALPNAAADAAGGLPISDAGGLDVDTQAANVAAILADTGTDGVLVATGAKTGYALTSGERTSIADALLDRDLGAGADTGSAVIRTVRQALRFLRNKVSTVGGILRVYKEDDSVESWSAAMTTSVGAAPITEIDPADS